MIKKHFKEIDSTNTYLKNNYKDLDNFTFVSADYQSAGRGRTGRVWDSKVGDNLLFSILIKDTELIDKFKAISIISAYSILSILKEIGLENISIKWPNDVYINDDKICGILLEGVTTDKFECVIVGIGLNVNQEEFNGEYLHSPTSIYKQLNKKINIEELKDLVFKRLEDNLIKLKEGHDFYPLIKEYDYLKDKDVFALIKEEKRSIKVLGIDENYSLKIKYDNTIENIESGEISFHI